jgi:hypothetical protein
MRKFLALFVILLALSTGGVVMAQSTATPLAPGAYEFFCGTGRLRHSFVDGNVNLVRLNCTTNGEGVPLPTPTETPVNTPAPTETPVVQPTETNTPAPTNMIDMYWHAPMAHGDRPTHEHGDAPPQFVLDFMGVQSVDQAMLFTHAGNTPGENMLNYKHTAFKGWYGEWNTNQGLVKWYGVFHLDTNPAGHTSRFHSYQLWVQDPSNNVSHFEGWVDFGTGNMTGPQKIVTCGVDSGIRPIMLVNQAGCNVRFENWYARAGGSGAWAPDFGFNINPTYFDIGSADPLNVANWQQIGGSPRNVNRRVEWAWYPNRSAQRGAFWATQFGQIVQSQNDPLCSATTTVGTKTYQNICLEQYIAPTLPEVSFNTVTSPGRNSQQRTFPSEGVLFPN